MVLERGRDFWLNSELQRSQLVDDDDDYLEVPSSGMSLANFPCSCFGWRISPVLRDGPIQCINIWGACLLHATTIKCCLVFVNCPIWFCSGPSFLPFLLPNTTQHVVKIYLSNAKQIRVPVWVQCVSWQVTSISSIKCFPFKKRVLFLPKLANV